MKFDKEPLPMNDTFIAFPAKMAEILQEMERRKLDLVQGFLLGRGLEGSWSITPNLSGIVSQNPTPLDKESPNGEQL
jgi:hypothetical protein